MGVPTLYSYKILIFTFIPPTLKLRSPDVIAGDNCYYMKCSIFSMFYSWVASWFKRLVARLPPRAKIPSSRLGHSMWVSWCTKRSLDRFFSGFLPFFLTTNFIPPFLQTSHPFRFISLNQPLWWWEMRDRPAPLLFTDLQYRGFITSHPSTQPSAGHELRSIPVLENRNQTKFQLNRCTVFGNINFWINFNM